MSTRFLHDQFHVTLPCPHCGGAGERTFKAFGHFSYDQSFVIESIQDEAGREVTLTEAERITVETRGDERYSQVVAENAEHQREVRRELNAEIRI